MTEGFRKTLGRFASGLVVIAAHAQDRTHGLTCQAFSSVSLDPPLVGAFLTKDSGTLWAIDQTKKFTVSILAADQIEIARVFALSGADKFRGIDVITAPSGLPVIADCLAWLDCELSSNAEAGDHVSILGLVKDLEPVRESSPLLYWRGGYGEFK